MKTGLVGWGLSFSVCFNFITLVEGRIGLHVRSHYKANIL